LHRIEFSGDTNMADGNCNLMIAQGGGPSMVINQSLVGAVLTALDHPAVNRVLGARHGIQGILDEDLVDLRRESRRTLEAVAATPSSALGSVRRKPTAEDCAAMFAVLRRREVRWFFYIGGNDSAETVHIIGAQARKAGMPLGCFHIPKTIDNDLLENDHTPGFGSAARFVACALMGDDLDNRALGGVKIDVIMGRHAGFLTAASALARTAPDDGPHLIYLPERPFEPARFVADVQAVVRRIGRCVVAVSEGIADASGTAIASRFSREQDSHGNAQLSGSGALGDLLAGLVRSRGGIKRVRADTLGYLQRSFPGVASAVDAREARQAAIAAVRAALGGRVASGSVALRRKPGPRYAVRFDIVPLRMVAKNTRQMPAAFIARKGNDVTQAFIDYARPIVGSLPAKALLKGTPA
jgi:6-phosphofructokinase 1